MRLQFGRAKHSKEDLERQAAEELKLALEGARPPSASERTWDQPSRSVPDVSAAARRPALVRDLADEPPDEAGAGEAAGADDAEEVRGGRPPLQTAPFATPKPVRRRAGVSRSAAGAKAK